MVDFGLKYGKQSLAEYAEKKHLHIISILPGANYTMHKVVRSMRLYFHIFSQHIVHGSLIPFAKMFEIINNIRIKAQS